MLNAREQISELERQLAAGDIGGASQTITRIYEFQDTFDAAARKEIGLLEAIYLSLVQLVTRPKRTT